MFLMAILLPVITTFMVLRFFLHGGEGEGEGDLAAESPQHHLQLPRFPYIVYGIRADESPPRLCVICRRRYRPHHELTLFPGCNHVFHARCLEPWLNSHQSCPLCRRDVAVNGDETSTTETSSAATDSSSSHIAAYQENNETQQLQDSATLFEIERIPEEPVEQGDGEPDIVGVGAPEEEYGSGQPQPDVAGVGRFSRCFALVRRQRARAPDPRESRADESHVAGVGPRGSFSRFKRFIESKKFGAQRKDGVGSGQPNRTGIKCFCRCLFHFIRPKKSLKKSRFSGSGFC